MDNYKSFIQKNAIDGGFLQSEEWREFQERTGNKTYAVKNKKGKVFANVVEYKLPVVGRYFFIPRGPILKIESEKRKAIDKIVEKGLFNLVQLAKKENIGWIRIEPQKEVDLQRIKYVLQNEFRIVKSLKNHQPAQTIMVDLSCNEEEILEKMKSKTRYNIRLSKRKGVQVFTTTKKQILKNF